MFFGAFLPLVLVVGLGLLVAVVIVVREVRKMMGLWERTGARNPPVPSGLESPVKESTTRYKPYRQDVREKQLPENKNEGSPAGGNLWRW